VQHCSDVTELRLKPRCHVGGILVMNNEWAKVRKCADYYIT